MAHNTIDIVNNWVKKNATDFNAYFKERDAEINGSLLALLSEEHVLLLGPPGTAKTLLANQIAGGHPNLKDGVCKGRPPLSWNCLVFYDKTSLT